MSDQRPAPRQSLSVRLLVLVVSVLVLVEVLFFVPGLQRERQRWLRERLNDAQLVALALRGGPVRPEDAAIRALVRRLTDAEAIRILGPGAPREVLLTDVKTSPSRFIDIDDESWASGFVRAVRDLFSGGETRLDVTGTSVTGTRLELVLRQARLNDFLRRYAGRFGLFSGTIVLVVGFLLFVVLRTILVLPLRRIARNIAAFRADPERGVPLDAARVSLVTRDEITMVAHALSGMQAELRTALWRNGRLAAVGTAVAKMSHDLRGILSSALLVADRLTTSREPGTQQAGEVIVRSVHRATALAQHTLDFVREGPPPLKRERVALWPLVAEVSLAVCGEGGRRCTLHNEIDAALTANVDRDSLLRVLTNLCRNAVQAGARAISIRAEGAEPALVLMVADNGPGLPQALRERLFRPFAPSGSGGSGLGLAIARDLMWAHGGDLLLARSGREGTCFALHFQQPRVEE
jgi:signal transduction histidine kinase